MSPDARPTRHGGRQSRPRGAYHPSTRQERYGISQAHRIVAVILAALATALVASAAGGAAPSPALLKQLERGGYVLVLRHAITDQSKQDEDPVDLSDCSTQRMLSAEGRAQARAIGRAVKRLDIPIGSVLTSRFCRTRETARLAFGGGTVSPALLNTIASQHDARWRAQIAAARRLFGTRPVPGKNTVLVTHGVVVADTTGLDLEEGELLVFRPLGNSRFRLAGRIPADAWNGLRKPASASALRVTEYDVPAGSGPHDVAPAADGTVWYTAQAAGKLGRLDPATRKVTEVPLGDGSAPHGVIVGPDGAAWVTDGGLNAIVRVDPEVARREALSAARIDRVREPQHRDVRPARPLVVHGSERHLRASRPRTGMLRVFRAPAGPARTGSRRRRAARSGTRRSPAATLRAST